MEQSHRLKPEVWWRLCEKRKLLYLKNCGCAADEAELKQKRVTFWASKSFWDFMRNWRVHPRAMIFTPVHCHQLLQWLTVLWSAHFTVQAYLKWLSSANKFWSLLPHQGWNAGQEGPLLHHRGRIKIRPVILIWKEEELLLKMMSQTKITNTISMTTAISEAPAHTQLLLM